MLITAERAKDRLAQSVIIRTIGKGRHGNQDSFGTAGRPIGKRIPDEIKALIYATAAFDTQKNVAKEFDTSQQNVSYIKNNPPEEVKISGEKHLESIHEKALDRVMKTLDLITDEKLEEVDSVNKLAGIARDLSGIVEKTSGGANKGNQVQVIVYAPKPNEESHYGEPIVIKGS